MIEREIDNIVENRRDDGTALNAIVDEFRRDRDVIEIASLLDSPRSDLVSIGAWILGELPFEKYDNELIISRLGNLTEHDDATVRFNALGALYPTFSREDAATKSLLARLKTDSNVGVRMKAEAAASRLCLD